MFGLKFCITIFLLIMVTFGSVFYLWKNCCNESEKPLVVGQNLKRDLNCHDPFTDCYVLGYCQIIGAKSSTPICFPEEDHFAPKCVCLFVKDTDRQKCKLKLQSLFTAVCKGQLFAFGLN